MPDILSTVRLIMLTSRDTITGIHMFECYCHISGYFMDTRSILQRQIIDILVVFSWHNNDMTRIIRPPPWRDKSENIVIPVNDILLTVMYAFTALDKHAKRAYIICWLMIEHNCTHPFYVVSVKQRDAQSPRRRALTLRLLDLHRHLSRRW